MKKTIWTLLALAFATSVSADNGNKENNDNHYGQIKNGTYQAQQPTSSVPEPATLGLMAAGVIAAGFAAKRRRKK